MCWEDVGLGEEGSLNTVSKDELCIKLVHSQKATLTAYLSVNFIQTVIHQLHGVGVREQLITCNVKIYFRKISEG